jgi:uncharacterized protein YjbI with pentapeptide repeats
VPDTWQRVAPAESCRSGEVSSTDSQAIDEGLTMAELGPKLKTTEPRNVFTKPLTADFKALFKALAKGAGHTAVGKWEEIASDTVEALSAIGLQTEPGELAFLLLRRSMTKALFELVGESVSQHLIDNPKDSDALVDQLDFTSLLQAVHIDAKFLDRPSELPLVRELQSVLRQWLEAHDLPEASASAVVNRLPSYFVYALNQEWRRNAKSYRPLIDALDTPFAKASDREWAWKTYAASLERQIDEGVFDEPFGLRQIYVPLNAYYVESQDRDKVARADRVVRRVVIALEDELDHWVQQPNPKDPIRVISGGPGSGKSSFAKIFAAKVAKNGAVKVLFVPLHRIDPAKELTDAVGRFVRDDGILLQNPLDPKSPEPNLLIIFDGLDELASQGKAAAETARAFVREVERTVEGRNARETRLRVLLSGRELVVQENESEFRRPRQILTLLPYFQPQLSEDGRPSVRDAEQYEDKAGLLNHDLRQEWWNKYGNLTGHGYKGLPKELSRADLAEVTAQPLLNYLVALSFSRKKLDFTQDINLNAIYEDLVEAVYERGYEKRRAYVSIRHMNLKDFVRVLEEVGLAAWHGDGRSTTVTEIEEHCKTSGLGKMLATFQEGAEAGVTRLLAAFFFRRYGQRPDGDPTFVFTHKSFGEYLTARRVVRGIERINRELESRAKSPDDGWDERDALAHWVQLCGPSAVSPDLHLFVMNETKLRDRVELERWQSRLSQLFSDLFSFGMPMERLPVAPFKKAMFQSRNAEEALLVALNACARATKQVSSVRFPDPTAFGSWFRRIQGQRTSAESSRAADCLSYLDLSQQVLHILDLYGANLGNSKLTSVFARYACFNAANLERADLDGAGLEEANLEEANLHEANLHGAMLHGASLARANLTGANLAEAILRGARLPKGYRAVAKT